MPEQQNRPAPNPGKDSKQGQKGTQQDSAAGKAAAGGAHDKNG
jgi:hypothetical protein